MRASGDGGGHPKDHARRAGDYHGSTPYGHPNSDPKPFPASNGCAPHPDRHLDAQTKTNAEANTDIQAETNAEADTNIQAETNAHRRDGASDHHGRL